VLHDFGGHHNDISQQMHNVARQLTGVEIATLAAYYSSFARAAAR
jgi:cytochrome c553